MEIIKNSMRIENNSVYISRYEVATAFFRTEEEENIDMANALNKIINMFCEAERKAKKNIVELPFDITIYKNVIDYIEKSCIY